MRHADVEIPDRMRPPHRVVDTPPPCPRLVGGPIRIDEGLGAQAPLPPRKGPLAEPRQHEEIQGAPVADEGEVDEGLPELVVAIDVLHQIRLVDDVDEMVGLGDPPEHAADAGAELRGVEHPLVEQLPHVEVRALLVRGIDPQEGGEQQALPAVAESVMDLGLHRERQAVAALPGMRGRVREAARFDLETAAQFDRAERGRKSEERNRQENGPAASHPAWSRSHRGSPACRNRQRQAASLMALMAGRIAEPVAGDTGSRAVRFLPCARPLGRPCHALPLPEAPTTARGFSRTDLTAPA